jgi:NAD(P)-dependent dehydrogenase (short-subunit alcohol dehydrogenase family)
MYPVLTSYLRHISFAIPELLKTKGRIVAVSSTAAQLRIPFSSDYCTSKHALIRFAEFIPIGELFQTAEYKYAVALTATVIIRIS